ncbi:MAG TPA: hypothetical protein PLD88_02165, partial [Candidatus Berkiella sp.]|nr:hypothetical protein [Candidatus Berkiella sp.]
LTCILIINIDWRANMSAQGALSFESEEENDGDLDAKMIQLKMELEQLKVQNQTKKKELAKAEQQHTHLKKQTLQLYSALLTAPTEQQPSRFEQMKRRKELREKKQGLRTPKK